jgi:hypothetical protein
VAAAPRLRGNIIDGYLGCPGADGDEERLAAEVAATSELLELFLGYAGAW